MKRKPFIYTFSFFFVLLLGIQSYAGEQRLTSRLGLKAKTIYLDPWYGGREKGPFLAQKMYGKDITLKIAQKLQGLLEAEGFTIPLSRTSDQFVPLDQRSLRAKSNGADIHLAIKVSRRKEDCIRIVILQLSHKEASLKSKELEAKNLSDLKTNLDEILKDLEVNSRHAESLALAVKMSKKLKSDRRGGCVRLLEGYDYILANAEMPAVIVDFVVSNTASEQPYILDETAQDKITLSLVESIKEYSDESVQPSAQ